MKNSRIAVAVLIIFITASLFCGSVAGRYADNTGIEDGDTVYLTEKGLDFSAMSWIEDGVEYTVDRLVSEQYGGYLIQLTDQKGDIPYNAYTGTYRLQNKTIGDLGYQMCLIQALDLGEAAVTPFGTDVRETHPDEIPKTTDILFYLDKSNLQPSQLTGNWCNITLKNLQNIKSTTTIKNSDGYDQSLIGIEDPTDKTNRDYSFKLIDQTDTVDSSNLTSMEIVFEINLNGIKEKITYPFDAVKYPVSLEVIDGAIAQGDIGEAVFTGTPYTEYNIEITETGSDIPFFSPGEGITLLSPQDITVMPDWSGFVEIPVTVPDNAPKKAYTINVYDEFGELKLQKSFNVISPKIKFVFNQIPTGDFAVGDTIKLSGNIDGGKTEIPVYLYVTGPGCGENGINLEGTPVVDEDESTFSVAYYTPSEGGWSYYWRTLGFDAIYTYTIHANLLPYGAVESSKVGGKGIATDLTHSLVLTEPSIHAKFSSQNNGIFTQGDYFYSFYYARGSPGVSEVDLTKGQVRWYIFGTNYRYTDINKDLALFSGENSLGTSPSAGNYGITYNRTFTNNLTPGRYVIIYQHPGMNNVFDVRPDIDVGEFSHLIDANERETSIASRQTDNAVYALESLLKSSYSDDLYVLAEFEIEKPWFNVEPLGNIAIGDSFTVRGTTNYAANESTADNSSIGNTFAMSVRTLEFYGADDNTAAYMPKIDATTTPSPITPYEGKRDFVFPSISTDTWYPGTYEITVTNTHTGENIKTQVTVTAQGFDSNTDTSTKSYDSALTQTLVPKTPTPTATPTATPAPTKTPFPVFAGLAFAVVLGFAMRRI